MEGTSLGDAIKTALLMKQESIENDRKVYNNMPPWLKYSLRDIGRGSKMLTFAQESDHYHDKINEAILRKNTAKDFIKQGNIRAALLEYYEALALFNWIVNTNKDTRQVLQDEYIKSFAWEGNNEQERSSIIELKAHCFTSISTCLLTLGEWDSCLHACKEALELNLSSTEAAKNQYYAISRDPRKTFAEHQLALKELKFFVKNNVEDKEIKEFYLTQMKEVNKMLQQEKLKFAKLFAKDHIEVVGSSSSGNGGYLKMSVQDAVQKAAEMGQFVDLLECSGNTEDASKLRVKHTAVSKALDHHINDTSLPPELRDVIIDKASTSNAPSTAATKRATKTSANSTNKSVTATTTTSVNTSTSSDSNNGTSKSTKSITLPEIKVEDERSRKVLAAMYEQIETLHQQNDYTLTQEQLLSNAVDKVRKVEALEAAKKWIQHIDTPTIMSMLRARSLEAQHVNKDQDTIGMIDGNLEELFTSRSRDALISALTECMANDIVELVREDSSQGCDQDLDLFARLMEKYEEGGNAGRWLEGLHSEEDKVGWSNFIRLAVFVGVVVCVMLSFVIYFIYKLNSKSSNVEGGSLSDEM